MSNGQGGSFRPFRDIGVSFYEWFFVWPYKAARFLVAHQAFEAGLNSYVYYGIIITPFFADWALSLWTYYSSSCNGPFLICEVDRVLKIFGWRGILIFFFRFEAHLLLIYSGISFYAIKKKSRITMTAKQSMDQNFDAECLGLNLITGNSMQTKNYAEELPVEIIGEGPLMRNIMMRFLEADAQRGKTIIILAPDEEKDLLEEVTMVLRERKQEEIRSFFYYSSNNKALSASYSPFWGTDENDIVRFLESWLELRDFSKEGVILGWLIQSLKSLGKPFGIDDLVALLEKKNIAFSIHESRFIHRYIREFESLAKHRRALKLKLISFGKNLRLDQELFVSAFPLNLPDILKSKKHLYLELEPKKNPLTDFLLWHLKKEICSYGRSSSPFIYLLYPERWADKYSLDDFNVNSVLRVFSAQPCYSYTPSRWNVICLSSSASEKVLRRRSPFMKEVKKEMEQLKNSNDFQLIINEEAFRAAELVANELRPQEALGLFRFGDYPYEANFSWFHIPPWTKGAMEYEPYQRRFKPADMLNLRKLATGSKGVLPDYDVSALDIIEDLKPREDGT